jgi:hypothetical protein
VLMTDEPGMVAWYLTQLDLDERDAATRHKLTCDTVGWERRGESLRLRAAGAHDVADVAAKRAIVELHTPVVPDDPAYGCPQCWTGGETGGPSDHPCDTLRLIVAALAHRPGYREEWRP